jgi:hypothetical protein
MKTTIDEPTKYKSEWLLFNANSTWFQLYHGENKLIFNEKMMMRSALYYTNTQNWIFHYNSIYNNTGTKQVK